MNLEHVILQQEPSKETRAAMAGALMASQPTTVVRAALAELAEPVLAAQLRAGAMPVGTVEFVREAMRVAGVTEPENLSYPPVLTNYLCRDVRESTAGKVLGHWFVKPKATKAFTGFVFDTMSSRDDVHPDSRGDYDDFMALPADAPVFISEPVEFVCEWRYYVSGGRILGAARYDPEGADDAPVPDASVVGAAALELASTLRHSVAMDFGVLAGGETALIEVNDAWAVGLYDQALEPKAFVAFLWERWQGLHAVAHPQLAESKVALDAARPRSRRRP
jgi:hypothetical protein